MGYIQGSTFDFQLNHGAILSSSYPTELNHEPDAGLPGQPIWRLALLYPPQGSWTEADYLELPGGPLIEFDSGSVEILDMPTKAHQRIVQFLLLWLHRYILEKELGEVFVAPLPVRLWADKFREPDIVFVGSGRQDYRGYPDGADLVIEVVSLGQANRRRDIDIKPDEYCRAGIAEYWIVDPELQCIDVLQLVEGNYQKTEFQRGQLAASKFLEGLTVSVDRVLDAALPNSTV